MSTWSTSMDINYLMNKLRHLYKLCAYLDIPNAG